MGLNRELVIVRAREGEPPLSDTDTQLGLQLYILTRRQTPRQSGPWIEADVLVENSDGALYVPPDNLALTVGPMLTFFCLPLCPP